MSLESVRSVCQRFVDNDYSVLADDIVGEAFGLGIKVKGPDAIAAAIEQIFEKN